MQFYPNTKPDQDIVALEKNVLSFWDRQNIFHKSVKFPPKSSNSLSSSNITNNFVFYDGPPFANGLPHYGHLLTGCERII